MSDTTVTVEVELSAETRDALAADGSPADALADLAAEEARLRNSVERYVGGGATGSGGMEDGGAGSGGMEGGGTGSSGMEGANRSGDGAGERTGAGSQVSATGLADLPPPIGVLLGFDAVEAGDGAATVEMAARPRHANPMGTLHGGVLCDLGDAAMGTAYATTLDDGETFATLELDAKYLKPVWTGQLTATASVVDGGRTVGLVECDVTDADGSLVARLQSVCLTLRGEQAAGR